MNNAKRAERAVEAYKNAATTIGEITPGMRLFALTRGQFSMIDAVLHCLDSIGDARISIWTWCVAEYEVQCFDRLRIDKRITDALLVIDHSAHKRNATILDRWRASHGPDSVKTVVNHAKIATLENSRYRLLLRGSMNLNYNPRFEQFDLSEGCAGFELIRRVETSLPVLHPTASYEEYRDATGLLLAHSPEALKPFSGVKVWAK